MAPGAAGQGGTELARMIGLIVIAFVDEPPGWMARQVDADPVKT